MADGSASATDAMERDVACDLCGDRHHTSLATNVLGRGCDFVRCTGCGLMFYSPRYTEAHVIERFLCAGDAKAEAERGFHTGVYVGEPEGGAEQQKATLQTYYADLLSIAAHHFRKLTGCAPESMFDVGASVGWLLKVARERVLKGSAPLVAGCDANVYSAEMATRGFNLDVRGTTFQAYDVDKSQIGRFDMASMLDYIEHTYTPFRDLKKLRTLMRPNGVLLLKTFLHEMDARGEYVHPIFHAHHFTAATLKRAVEQSGWTIRIFDTERERAFAQVLVYASAA